MYIYYIGWWCSTQGPSRIRGKAFPQSLSSPWEEDWGLVHLVSVYLNFSPGPKEQTRWTDPDNRDRKSSLHFKGRWRHRRIRRGLPKILNKTSSRGKQIPWVLGLLRLSNKSILLKADFFSPSYACQKKKKTTLRKTLHFSLKLVK